MKIIKILSVCLIISLILVSCGNKDKNNNMKDDLSSTVSDVQSKVESGISDVESGIESMMPDESSLVSEEAPDKGVSSEPIKEVQITPANIELSSLDNTKQGWGQGVQVDDKNRPVSSVKYQEKYGKYDAYFIGSGEKCIYLTFDEGYENGYTATILDTLKEKGVKAVFFVTMDYAKKQPELIKRMIAEGHIVGNHSDKHVSYPTVDMARCEAETMNLHNYISENFGYEMTLFRPPMGEFSERVLAQMQSLGYKTLLWSFAYKDWEVDNQPDEAASLQKLNGALHDGALYLLHAVGSTNNNILGDFIDYAHSQGYQFKLMQ